ncbi:multidrug efflux SMR transporter [Desulfovibrio sp. OttesenSCG-928-I05]|nr:multidrug efflux SMR transporter [Desulfovibrio sp. OttesenSCG-928-I05]
MMHWLLLFIAILCETLASAAVKLSEGFTRPVPTVGLFIGYGVSLYLFSLAIKTIPVGIAYAVWSGVGVALIVALGWYFFGQKLDLAALVGLAFIIAGILIIHLFSKSIS